uniref:Uncharacterized protein n=1 Tax=Melopsittacus undulatus TaxID=13146 RepID=A0A8V5GHH2_MELUD
MMTLKTPFPPNSLPTHPDFAYLLLVHGDTLPIDLHIDQADIGDGSHPPPDVVLGLYHCIGAGALEVIVQPIECMVMGVTPCPTRYIGMEIRDPYTPLRWGWTSGTSISHCYRDGYQGPIYPIDIWGWIWGPPYPIDMGMDMGTYISH